MAKYYTDLVNRGFGELHPVMVNHIVREMKKRYRADWWDEILRALQDQKDLPYYGDEEELIDSLDRANCVRLIFRRSKDLFYDFKTANKCRAWASELQNIRNEIAHDSVRDMEQKDAERYLDTMVRLADTIDARCADRIRELYQEVRSAADDVAAPMPEGYYPEADQSGSPHADDFDLLSVDDPEIIELTGLSHKLTVNGETLSYPVYRVRLDKLYYNDRNDRILTWISQYKDENGVDDLSGLSREAYNRVIEEFIVQSNPTSIERTRTNIALRNQLVPGVTLSDGRIIDGNRRFSCLRMLSREDPAFNYFETVILKQTPTDSAKQIKLLELAIQHGEESKVDYSQLELVLGAWLDIVKTGLITEEEYAANANETLGEVRKKLEIAQLVVEFLEFIKTPGQYHIARDKQVYSVLVELLPLLKKCKTEREKQELKQSVFTNALLSTFPDQRKYIRNLNSLYGTQPYKTYIQRETRAAEQISEALGEHGIGGSEDLEDFVAGQSDLKAELTLSFEKALSQSRKAQTKNKPAKNVGKCIELLMEIDTDIFAKLSEEECGALRAQFKKLNEVAAMITGELPDEE